MPNQNLITYLTINSDSTYEIPKIKWSKFIWYLFPVNETKKAEFILENHRKTYHDATHHCRAYRIWTDIQYDLFWNTIINSQNTKFSDDWEPTNTAWKPILSVLTWTNLHNILCIVTRYFGWTLLWVGWLIQAYTDTTKQAIQHSQIITAKITSKLQISYPYEKTAQISHLISKYNAKIIVEEYGDLITQTIEINYWLTNKIKDDLTNQFIKIIP